MATIERGLASTQEDQKIEAFEDQQEIMQRIMEMGFEKYAETLPNLLDAFDLEKHKPAENLDICICCMDGRTPFGVHSAGSGILLPKEELKKYFKESGATAIASHKDCGASKIYAEMMGLDVNDSDNIGEKRLEEMAKEMGVPYINLGVEKSFHSERVVYYDGTGKFNYAGVEGLPEGFVVSRKYMTEESSLKECGIAKSIAFGHHGFGEELLNQENPFLFVVVAETEKEMQVLKKELAGFVASFGDKVAIDGFLVPKDE